MDRAIANKILVMLKGYYPRQYPSNLPDDQCRFIVDDLVESFKGYNQERVIELYKEWHLENSFPPSVADILKTLRAERAQEITSNNQQKQYEFYEKDGVEYAREVSQ